MGCGSTRKHVRKLKKQLKTSLNELKENNQKINEQREAKKMLKLGFITPSNVYNAHAQEPAYAQDSQENDKHQEPADAQE